MSETSSRSFGSLKLLVLTGDIAEQKVDAIVNAANNRFWMGGGVAGAIKRRGGAGIEAEAMRLGPVEPGRSVTTSAGSLPARHVIHAAVMGQDLLTDGHLIRAATRSALAEATRLKLETIAFPALGTGVGGFPVEEAATIMIGAAVEHGLKNELPREVEFVLFTPGAFEAFSRALAAAPVSPRTGAQK